MDISVITCPNPDCAGSLPIEQSAADGQLTCPKCGKHLSPSTSTGTAVFEALLESHGEALTSVEVASKIAQGGMGAILSGRDKVLGRQLAVKMMRPHLKESAGQKLRFISEAQITGQLEHPNIVPIHQLGKDEAGNLFYTMKLVKGRTLRELLNDDVSQPGISELLGIFLKVCDAVSFAHSREVIHRDLKPENVMLGDFGEVMVMDWGLAKPLRARPMLDEDEAVEPLETVADGPELIQTVTGTISDQVEEVTVASTPLENSMDSETIRNLRAESDVQLTLEGQVHGTPAYMSPEQARGRITELGPATDIYSLGGILYFILTHCPPVDGESVHTILGNVIAGDIVPPAARTPRRDIPAELSAIAMKAMATDSTKRYESVSALTADLRRYLEGHSVSAKQDSLGEMFIKLLRRNKPATFATIAVILISLAITAGFIGTLIHSEDAANRSAQLAIEQADRAGKETAKAKAAHAKLLAEIEATRKANARANFEEQRADRFANRAKQAETASETAVGILGGAFGDKNVSPQNRATALARFRELALERALQDGDTGALRRLLAAIPEDERDEDWHYFHRQTDESILSFSQFNGRLRHQILDPRNGRECYLVQEGLKRLDLNSGKSTASYSTQKPITMFTVAQDGSRVASALRDSLELPVFDAESTKEISRLIVPGDTATCRVVNIGLNLDGSRLLASTSIKTNGFFQRRFGQHICFDVASGRQLWTRFRSFDPTRGTMGELRVHDFFNDGAPRLLAHGPKFQILDADTGKTIREIASIPMLYLPRVSPNGRMLAGKQSGHRRDLRVYDLGTGKPLGRAQPFKLELRDLVFASDRALICYGADSESLERSTPLRIVDPLNGRLIGQLVGTPEERELKGANLLGHLWLDQARSRVMLRGDTTKVWQVPHEHDRRLKVAGPPSALEFLRNDTLLVAHRGQPIKLFRVGPRDFGSIITNLHHPTNALLSQIAVGNLGRSLVVPIPATPREGFVFAHFPKADETAHRNLPGEFSRLVEAHFGATRKQLAAVVADAAGASIQSAVWIWNLDQPEEQPRVARSHQGDLVAQTMAFVNRDQNLLLTRPVQRGNGRARSLMTLLAASNHEALRQFLIEDDIVTIATSLTGKKIAMAGAKGRIHAYHGEKLDHLLSYRAHSQPINVLAHHPTRSIVASAGADRLVKISNYRTGQLLATYRPNLFSIHRLRFNLTGNLLACSGNTKSVVIWDLSKLIAEPGE